MITFIKQECIPLGCVLSVAVAVSCHARPWHACPPPPIPFAKHASLHHTPPFAMYAPFVTHSPPLPCTPLLRHTCPPHVNRITDRYKQECIPVGCVPPACCPYLLACTALGGVVYLPRGVPGPGRECTCPGGVPGPGEYLLRGMYLAPGGTCPGTPPPPWTEWQTGVNILPCPKLSFAGGKKIIFPLLLWTVINTVNIHWIDTGNLSYWWGARDMYDTEPEIWYRILRCANRHRNANASDFYGTKYRGLEVQV